MVNMPYKSKIKVKFCSEKACEMVKIALSVDEELQPSKLVREITVEGGNLIASFMSSDLKVLRVSMSGILDSLKLAAKTLNEFYDVQTEA